MEEHRQTHSLREMGFMVPLILFVLLFVLCSGVVACVFLRASAISRDTEAYNAAVTLCRNQAECIRAGEIPADGSILYYDENLQPTPQASATYYLVVEDQTQKTENGELHSSVVTAYSAEQTQLYRLEVAAYLPQGR